MGNSNSAWGVVNLESQIRSVQISFLLSAVEPN